MKQLLLTIPRMMEEVLKKVENEELNASDDKKKYTKKLISDLRKITSDMRCIAESHNNVSNSTLFKMLGDLQNLQSKMPKISPEQLEDMRRLSPELNSIMGIKESLKDLPSLEEVVEILKQEVPAIEKSPDAQSTPNRVDSAKKQ